MEFKEVQQKAVELRDKFEKLEIKSCGRKWSRTEIMADIGQLSKLVMAKEGLRKDLEVTDEVLEHELADCLWCVLVLANEFNIDLEKSMVRMAENDSLKIEKLLSK